MIKNILFRADSSSTIGTGHIMRDLVLASQYSDANIIFATQNLEGNINHKISEAGYKIELLQSNDADEIIRLIKKLEIDFIVIDSYKIDYKYEQTLKEKTNVKILAFDDNYEKHHCDIILNHNISADKERYKGLVPDDCELRCGTEFTLVRDEFYKEKTKKLKLISQKSKLKIFVAMGGSDPQGYNLKIIQLISHMPNIKCMIITTSANRRILELKDSIKNLPNFKLYIDSDNIAKLMNKSDIALITPSVVINEVIFMNLPFVAIKIIENQHEIYEFLKKEGFYVLNNNILKLPEYIELLKKENNYNKQIKLILQVKDGK